MSDLLRRLEQVRLRVGRRWDPQKVEHVLGRLHARIARRRKHRAAVFTTAAAAAAAVLALVLMRHDEESARSSAQRGPAPTAGIAAPRSVLLADGSTARLLETETVLTVVEDAPERTTMSLERGVGQFDVRHSHRVFRVEAGEVSIRVLGTMFTVDRTESAVAVWVTRGRVSVDWPGGTAQLIAGQHGWFPPPATDAVDLEETDALGPPPPSEGLARQRVRRVPSGGRHEDWRSLAEHGRYSDACAALRRLPAKSLKDPESLLIAADVMRLSGHPTAAVPYFERVVTNHWSDSRAPGAAFSLARILLNTLHRPSEAAVRFAEARSLSPNGALAQDALAREVEAWSRAGLTTKARETAREYLRLYPNGRRAMAARLYGGLD